MNTIYRRAAETLQRGRTFLITTHVNPDGDAIGSALGLMHALTSMGKRATVMLPSSCPQHLLWMPGSKKMKVWENSHADHRLVNEVDTIVVLDLNTLKRLGSLGEAIAHATGVVVVNIDHHANPQDFASVACIDTDAPATAAMLAEMIDDDHMTSEAAACFFTGIMTDTGSFRFPRTTAVLFREAARLVDAGADPVESYERTVNVNSFARMQLLGLALKGLQLLANGQLCVMVVRKRDMKATHSTTDDTEGFVQHTLSVVGVRMGILILEAEDAVKVSFRSKGATHVRKLAESYGGGGHDHAAGARFGEPLSHVMERVVKDAVSVLRSANAR